MIQSEKDKKKKALLVLPLIALPFVTLAFWALGGGSAQATGAARQQGINTTLPSAKLPETFLDKMSLYNKAAQDSLNLKSQLTGGLFGRPDTVTADTFSIPHETHAADFPASATATYADANETKVRAKLVQLEQSLNQPPPPPATPPAITGDELALQQATQPNEPDPQMQQLNGMLEKVLDIEHPDRVKDRLREQSIKNRGRVYPVETAPQQGEAAVFGSTQDTAPRCLLRSRNQTPFMTSHQSSRIPPGSRRSLRSSSRPRPLPAVLPSSCG